MTSTPSPDAARSVLLLHGVGSSADTWWRLEEDLRELGWSTLALDLPGHGDRRVGPGGLHALADFSDDVRRRLAGRRFDLLLGHSLGAVVALDLLTTSPEVAARVVLVDPPALGGALTVDAVADELVTEAARAHADPDGLRAEVAARNPRWARVDVDGVVGNRRRLDADAVAAFLRGQHWDLPAMVADCPVPVTLVAAEGPETALVEPARGRVLAALPSERQVLVAGGHGVHRDRPALFLHALLRLAGAA